MLETNKNKKHDKDMNGNKRRKIEVVSTLFVDRTHNNVLLDKLRGTECGLAALTVYRI